MVLLDLRNVGDLRFPYVGNIQIEYSRERDTKFLSMLSFTLVYATSRLRRAR